jgi:hypothetical protein
LFHSSNYTVICVVYENENEKEDNKNKWGLSIVSAVLSPNSPTYSSTQRPIGMWRSSNIGLLGGGPRMGKLNQMASKLRVRPCEMAGNVYRERNNTVRIKFFRCSYIDVQP